MYYYVISDFKMASYWQHAYFLDSLKSEFNENFKNKEEETYQRALLNLEVEHLCLIRIMYPIIVAKFLLPNFRCKPEILTKVSFYEVFNFFSLKYCSFWESENRNKKKTI